ncbi:plastocyanin/azurin family copper-binding protein [Hoeflea poritis]|uniref:Blue (type 1) copper domain-containing protein n=1 Tax=Hoeflea poritis TaxID=2993659 RepID=A0ABT4VTW5_9HYPH|nr:plastocyanin/azurin family copper-binding protein [Hoeflea poritis]MDA4848161.1 hypothetical protein [Hoeflea poritis]
MPGSVSRRTVVLGAAASAVVPALQTLSAQPKRTHDIAIKAFRFEPEHMRVRIGDTIRWTNHDLAPHTATSDRSDWGTETLAQGQSGEIVVTEGMQTGYFCAFHPHMKGAFEIA